MLDIKDKDKFINDGPFWEAHPDVLPTVTRFEQTDGEGMIVESYERFADGRMHDVTERDKLRQMIAAMEEKFDKMNAKEENNDALKN